MREMTCAEVDDSAPGYALDILEPGRRSLVASHILRCVRCRETVTRTKESADRLLDFGEGAVSAPYEPPTDWFDDVDVASGTVVRPRRRLRVAAAMAAVLALVVGTTLGPELEQATGPAPSPTLAVPLMAASGAVGSVRVYDGQPPVLQVVVTGLVGRDAIRADLVDGTGRVETLGHFRLSRGRAGWASTEPRDMPRPKSLLLVDPTGNVLAQATLS